GGTGRPLAGPAAEQAVQQGAGAADAVQRQEQHHRREQGEEEYFPQGGAGDRAPEPARLPRDGEGFSGVQRPPVTESDVGRSQLAQLLTRRQQSAGSVAYVLAAEAAFQPAAPFLVPLGRGGHANPRSVVGPGGRS